MTSPQYRWREKKPRMGCQAPPRPSGSRSPTHPRILTLGAHQTQLGQFCFVFLLSWALLSLSIHPLSPLLSPALSMVCSPALCLLPKSPGPWLILLLFLVCGVFFGSLSPERPWAAKGAQSPQVKAPSTAVSPVRCRRAGRGTRGAPMDLAFIFPLFIRVGE